MGLLIEKFNQGNNAKKETEDKGGLLQQKFGQQDIQKPTDFGFMERLKMSFGGKETAEKAKEIEKQAGLAGKFEIGDIADIIGGTLPIIGGFIGGTGGAIAGMGVGAVPGAAIGATAGESVRQAIGRGLGVREGIPLSQEMKDVVLTGVGTYAGGKAIGVLAKAPGIKQTLNFFTKAVPERLYSTFFKTTTDDMAKQIKSGAMAKIQQTNPDMFDDFVKQGIIRMKSGQPVEINPTLARQALEKSFGSKATGGSLEKMAEYSYVKQFELEAQARNLVKNSKEMIDLGSNKQGYIKMLKDIFDAFDQEGYGFLKGQSNEAKEIYNTLKNAVGTKINAETALKLRRTMDSLRSSSSFRESPKLSLKQGIFKNAANQLREKLTKISGLKDLMKDYKFYIDVADGLVAEAARRGNTKIFSLFDAMVGGSSIGGGLGAGGGLGLLAMLRTVQTPVVLTAIARGLYGLPETMAKKITPKIGVGIGQIIKNKFGE